MCCDYKWYVVRTTDDDYLIMCSQSAPYSQSFIYPDEFPSDTWGYYPVYEGINEADAMEFVFDVTDCEKRKQR